MHFMPPADEGAISMEDVLDDDAMVSSIQRTRQFQVNQAKKDPAFKERMTSLAKELMEIQF